ncbi:AI-2E family transporter [Neotabrizicola shimadae]|uniref:AI-2E family transporter n=1 Tax=Neotabrizicola shimadae TaxID=2807096 RepID=A0A8G0ZU69_9RHOB|nr:AI-2E family transporter [Neotabrizicola shimadae]QYZ69515.1 AI-2E family transporter [Neotabrizicola shimadae]
MTRSLIETSSFILLVVLISAGLVWLVLPYFGGVLWAVIFSILFRPLFLRLLSATGGRKTLAAALSLLTCIFIVLIPAAVMLQSLLAELSVSHGATGTGTGAGTGVALDPAAAVQSLWNALPLFVTDTLTRFGIEGPGQLREMVATVIGEIANTATRLSLQVGQGTLQLTINLGVMLYTLFFLFRDGPAIMAAIRRCSPLSPDHTARIIDRFASVVRATIKGNVIIAIVQGVLGGVIFWLLGIDPALLWGFAMMLLALLPVVGAALVWFPFGVILLLGGDVTKGLILLAYGTLVISVVDNLLRPALVGRDLRLPDYVVLISTLGGLSVAGANGFVLGPMIAALFFAVWSLFAEEQAATPKS